MISAYVAALALQAVGQPGVVTPAPEGIELVDFSVRGLPDDPAWHSSLTMRADSGQLLGLIKLNKPAGQAVVLRIMSSNGPLVSVMPRIVVPAGQQSWVFLLRVRGESISGSDTRASATLRVELGNVSKEATIVFERPTVPAAKAESPPAAAKSSKKKKASARPAAPSIEASLDVNHDGVIDVKDVGLLMKQFNDTVEKRIQPLVLKAGVQPGKDGHLPPDTLKMVAKNLTSAELSEFTLAMVEAVELRRKVRAAVTIAMPGFEKAFDAMVGNLPPER